MLPQIVKDAFKKHDFRPSKSMGQHFLFDLGILSRIAETAELNPQDTVLEIGIGTGSLTSVLAPRCRKVIALELDRRLCQISKEVLSPYTNVEVVEGDIMKIDLKRLVPDKRYKVVGNLPYYITTPMIMKLMEERARLESITVTTQKEVAERISAAPGGKDYGSISVAVQFHCHSEQYFVISSSFFYPRPQVASAVLRLKVREHPAVEVADEKVFFRVVRACFAQRRKTLLNALSAGLALDRERIRSLLQRSEVDPRRRGETLSLEEFAKITALLAEVSTL